MDLEPYKNISISFPSTTLPELKGLMDLFNEKFQPPEDLEIYEPMEAHLLSKRLYHDCYQYPDKEFYLELEGKFPDPRRRFGPDGDEINQNLLDYLGKYFGAKPTQNHVKGWVANRTSLMRGDLWEYFKFNKEKLLKQYGVGVSGTYYYPPGGFREWHTNRDGYPGWRMYYVRVSEEAKSWFYYINPETDQLVKVPDRDDYFNLFYITDRNGVGAKSRPDYFWHNVVSQTHRRSLGLKVSEEMVQKIIKDYELTSV